jgi:hypothetical protein
MVRLPVKEGTHICEGITEKREIQEGVYLAAAITKAQESYAITSIANTNSDVEIDEPVLEVAEIERGTEVHPQDGDSGRQLNRAEEVLKRLRLEHLNEERQQVEKTCTAYQDIFHLPGKMLTSTTAVKHEIRIELGVEPVNVKPYQLPQTQKQEVRRQVEELRRGGIITESSSPWDSPLLIVQRRRTRQARKSGG